MGRWVSKKDIFKAVLGWPRFPSPKGPSLWQSKKAGKFRQNRHFGKSYSNPKREIYKNMERKVMLQNSKTSLSQLLYVLKKPQSSSKNICQKGNFSWRRHKKMSFTKYPSILTFPKDFETIYFKYFVDAAKCWINCFSVKKLVFSWSLLINSWIFGGFFSFYPTFKQSLEQWWDFKPFLRLKAIFELFSR